MLRLVAIFGILALATSHRRVWPCGLLDTTLPAVALRAVDQSPIVLGSAPFYVTRPLFDSPRDLIRTYHFEADTDTDVDAPHPEPQWLITNQTILSEDNAELYELRSFHVHQPAEHVLVGKPPGDLEIHLVFHSVADPTIIMVEGFLAFVSDHTSDMLRAILAGRPFRIPSLDTSRQHMYWTYTGSLTVPDSEQQVDWIVGGAELEITPVDLTRFANMSRGSRPVQPRAGRNIVDAVGARLRRPRHACAMCGH